MIVAYKVNYVQSSDKSFRKFFFLFQLDTPLHSCGHTSYMYPFLPLNLEALTNKRVSYNPPYIIYLDVLSIVSLFMIPVQ